MIQRRKFNRINALYINNGEWSSNWDILQSEVVSFFENLYSDRMNNISRVQSDLFPWFSDQDIVFLENGVTNEIKKALFYMATLKAFPSDGFHAHFFQS